MKTLLLFVVCIGLVYVLAMTRSLSPAAAADDQDAHHGDVFAIVDEEPRLLCVFVMRVERGWNAEYARVSVQATALHRHCRVIIGVPSGDARFDAHQHECPSEATCHRLRGDSAVHWQRRRNDTWQMLQVLADTVDSDTPAQQKYTHALIARADSAVYPKNAKRLLRNLRSLAAGAAGRVHYLGHTLQHEPTGELFNYALSGYLVTRVFIERVLELPRRPCAGADSHYTEDDYDRVCLKDAGLDPVPVRDANGGEYFGFFRAGDHFRRMLEPDFEKSVFWRNKRHGNVGDNCCAQYPVLFGNYQPAATLQMMYSGAQEAPTIEQIVALEEKKTA